MVALTWRQRALTELDIADAAGQDLRQHHQLRAIVFALLEVSERLDKLEQRTAAGDKEKP